MIIVFGGFQRFHVLCVARVKVSSVWVKCEWCGFYHILWRTFICDFRVGGDF